MIALRRALSAPFAAASLAILVAALVLAGAAVARAVATEPPPSPEHEAPVRFATLQGGSRTPVAYIDDAVAAAPFTASREAVEPVTQVPEAAAQPTVALQLQGTVLGGDGDSFVLIATEGAVGKVVRVGDTISGYRLRSIGQGSAELTEITSGKRIELRVPRSR